MKAQSEYNTTNIMENGYTDPNFKPQLRLAIKTVQVTVHCVAVMINEYEMLNGAPRCNAIYTIFLASLNWAQG